MNSKRKRFALGQTYFAVVFADENLTVPIVQTLVYIKKERGDDRRDYFLFRELTPGDDNHQRSTTIETKPAPIPPGASPHQDRLFERWLT